MKKALFILVIFVVGVWLAGATGAAVPLGSDFVYQGKLNFQGDPAYGVYDFRFRLYDAASGGSQVGVEFEKTKVVVDGGSFSVPLNFGVSTLVFDGDARWLEISVKPGGGKDYTLLDPRQPIKAVPYALYAKRAEGLQNPPVVAKPEDDFYIELEIEGINGPANGKFVFHEFDMLEETTDVIEFQNGNDPYVSKRPGLRHVGDIVLTRYMRSDTPFLQWMNDVDSGKSYKKSIDFKVWNKRGEMIVSRVYYNCWPSRWECMPGESDKSVKERVQLVSEDVMYRQLDSRLPSKERETIQVLLPVSVEIEAVGQLGGISVFSGLMKEIEVIEYQDGDDLVLRKRPGRVKYGTCGLGYYGGDNETMWTWYDANTSSAMQRRAVSIIFDGLSHNELFRMNMYECWPSKLAVEPGEAGEEALHKVYVVTEYFEMNY